MPNWDLKPVRGGSSAIHLVEGHWVVSDGGSERNAVSLGHFSWIKGHVSLEPGSESTDGPRALVLQYRSDSPPSFHEIVVDSGYIVIFCQDAARAAGVTDREWERLQYKVIKEAATSITLIADVSGMCIGLFAAPNYGDGTYALDYRDGPELQSLRIELEFSN
jgi:hypothetical protein